MCGSEALTICLASPTQPSAATVWEKGLCPSTRLAGQPCSSRPEWQGSGGGQGGPEPFPRCGLAGSSETYFSSPASRTGREWPGQCTVSKSRGPHSPWGGTCEQLCLLLRTPDWRPQHCRVRKPGRTSWRRSKKGMTLGAPAHLPLPPSPCFFPTPPAWAPGRESCSRECYLPLCTPCTSDYFSANAQEKLSITLATGVAPIMGRKCVPAAPLYEGRKISRRRAAGKVKTQAGWGGKFAER